SVSVQAQASIPSPASVLGFAPGQDRTIADWHEITNYFARLDAASNRVQVETIGQTTLKRPLIVAYISAPENIRELNRFKEIQRKLADPRTVAGEQERDRLIHEGKAIVAITCSIHSTEIVASQMSMQLAFELATARDEETREILSNTILLLIPSVNPDGVDIVASWYRKTLGTAYEGTAPPELYHHYAGHDDNRDWFMLNLQETRLVTRLFWQEWFPEIVYDVHQQGQNGSRFFIPPFYDPPNPNIHPLLIREIAALGSRMAADLQAANFAGVITNSLYDTWWHGGLRTSPYYHNSIGILSEAASAKLMTPVVIKEEQLAKSKARGMPSALEAATNFPNPWRGGLWRPRDIMDLEMTAARSLLTMAAKYRTHYLRNFYELGRDAAMAQPQSGQPLAYLIPAGQGNDESVARMIEILLRQGVEVHRMTRELEMSLAGHQQSEAFMEVPLNSYLIYTAQPQRRNLQALFERQAYPQRLTPTGEAEQPYDVAGWTLPMQMGVEINQVIAIKEPPAERRTKLLTDANEVRKSLGLALQQDNASPIPNPLKSAVRLGVYQSHLGSTDEGWTRWLLDTFNVPYQSLFDRDARGGNLSRRFDVIILPSERAEEIIEGNAKGSYPEQLTGGITLQGVENLRRFVEDGGTLICFDASTELAIKQFKLPLRNALEGLKTSEFYCPGSILRIDVNNKEPLARGLPEEMDAYFINSSAFEATDAKGVRVIARYAKKDVLRSGWLLGESKLAGRIALAEVTLGKGRVVLFGFRPQHRGQTWGTFPFIFNAISAE
ncbi:MAG: peptidase M14, partial [Acidobacteria bacterium]|nr:peptidase M14 [Acidobacteriota bacterium]